MYLSLTQQGLCGRPTACASPAPRSAAERRQVEARVGRRFFLPLEKIQGNNKLFRVN